MARYKTIEEATKAWVKEFNSIPQRFIQRAFPHGLDELEILATELQCVNCGCTEFTAEGDPDGGDDILTCMSCGHNEFRNTYGFPMWGTMWTFGDSIDEEWARDHGGAEIMRECGFWVYDDEDLGVFFGINGAGYDFYEQHWIPLYRKRGLHWHEEQGE